MTYGSAHRFLLRTVASQGVLSLIDVQKVLHKFTGNNEEIRIQDMVKEINDEIRQFQQEIKIANDEVTDEAVVVFMSVGYDHATKSQNIFSANALEFFRELIEQIMTTESRQITGIAALNLVGKMKTSFTKSDAQKLLNIWCKMRYLDKETNNYALGVRAIHEFEGYLRENMPDTIAECYLCKKIVYRGYNCPGCSLAIHTRCLKRYLEKVMKWPCCKIDFDAEQLERLNNDSSRLTQTQHLEATQSTVYNTIVEPTMTQETIEDIEMTQDFMPDTSQKSNRKRKRQYE